MAKQVLRTVANGTPLNLILLNPSKGAKTMATAKAKKKAKPRSTTTRAKTNRTRTAATTRTRTASGHFRAKPKARKKNPLVIYKTKRNSASGGTSSDVVNFSVAGLTIGLARPLVQPFVARFIPAQFVVPVTAAGTGWLLSKGFNYFGMTRRLSNPAKLIGYSTAIIALLSPYVSRWMASSQMGAGGGETGMAGIGVSSRSLPAFYPRQIAPAPTAQTRTGVSGIGVSSTPGRAPMRRR